MGRSRGTDSEMALAFEATYGTAPASGYFQMPFRTSRLGASRALIDDDILGLGRDPQAPTQDVVSAGGAVPIPMDAENLGTWLTMLLGTPTSTGSADPYTHVFTSGVLALPSASIEIGHPSVPWYDMVSGCMANTLSFEMSRGSGSLLGAEMMLMAQGSADDTSSNAGTPTELGLQRFSHFVGSVSRDSSALGNVTGVQVEYTNNLDPVEVIRADGKVGGFDPARAALTGSITTRFDSTALITQATDFDSCAIDLVWQISASRSLTWAMPRVFLEKPVVGIEGPAGVDVTFSFRAAQQANGDPMLTATLVNSTAGYNGSDA